MTTAPLRSRLLGAVLAGGASRRLGRDKAAESVGGDRMIDRAVSALEPHCARVVVVSSRPDTPHGPWTRIEDLRPDGGPLAGIEAALEHASGHAYDGAVVLAVDLPLVDAEGVSVLVRAYDASDRADGRHAGSGAVVAARTGDPDFEPLCALYPVSALPEVRTLLDDGARAARALFEAVGGDRVEVRGAGHNVNDEAGLDAATAALEARG